MAARQVADVDVVAHARAVGGVVVVAKDVDGLALADGGLSHVGNQVVGDALGVLAHEPGGVGADGVEVAQQHNVPLGVGGVQVGQDLLDHPLGPAIGVGGGLLGAGLGQRQGVRVSVDGGGAAEDDGLAAVVAHDVNECEGVAQVVGVVLDGLGDRLAYGLEAGKVDDAVDLVRGEDLLQCVAVVDVGDDELEVCGGLGADDGLDAVLDLCGGVGEVVHDDDLVAVLKQLDAGVAADEAGAAGHEHASVLRGEGLAHGGVLSLGMISHLVSIRPACVDLARGLRAHCRRFSTLCASACASGEKCAPPDGPPATLTPYVCSLPPAGGPADRRRHGR